MGRVPDGAEDRRDAARSYIAASKQILADVAEAERAASGEYTTPRGDLSVSLVAKLEQGKKADPRASTLLALARSLGVTPGTLLDDLLPAKKLEPEP